MARYKSCSARRIRSYITAAGGRRDNEIREQTYFFISFLSCNYKVSKLIVQGNVKVHKSIKNTSPCEFSSKGMSAKCCTRLIYAIQIIFRTKKRKENTYKIALVFAGLRIRVEIIRIRIRTLLLYGILDLDKQIISGSNIIQNADQ